MPLKSKKKQSKVTTKGISSKNGSAILSSHKSKSKTRKKSTASNGRNFDLNAQYKESTSNMHTSMIQS